jgi:hypothetical protein
MKDVGTVEINAAVINNSEKPTLKADRLPPQAHDQSTDSSDHLKVLETKQKLA